MYIKQKVIKITILNFAVMLNKHISIIPESFILIDGLFAKLNHFKYTQVVDRGARHDVIHDVMLVKGVYCALSQYHLLLKVHPPPPHD